MLWLALIGFILVKQPAAQQNIPEAALIIISLLPMQVFLSIMDTFSYPNCPVPLKNRGLTKVKAQAFQAALNPVFCVWIPTEKPQTLNLILNCVYSQ